MKTTRYLIAVIVLSGSVGLAPFAALAQEAQSYAGQEMREVKALDPARMRGLMDGAGLGYAKAAELNGWPGPLHALELQAELSLSAEQIEQIKSLREEMLVLAVPLGHELIEAERELDHLFASGSATRELVEAATMRVANLEGRLRAVHLNAHLDTTPVLTRHQRMLYARARGYTAGGHHGAAHGAGHGG